VLLVKQLGVITEVYRNEFYLRSFMAETKTDTAPALAATTKPSDNLFDFSKLAPPKKPSQVSDGFVPKVSLRLDDRASGDFIREVISRRLDIKSPIAEVNAPIKETISRYDAPTPPPSPVGSQFVAPTTQNSGTFFNTNYNSAMPMTAYEAIKELAGIDVNMFAGKSSKLGAAALSGLLATNGSGGLSFAGRMNINALLRDDIGTLATNLSPGAVVKLNEVLYRLGFQQQIPQLGTPTNNISGGQLYSNNGAGYQQQMGKPSGWGQFLNAAAGALGGLAQSRNGGGLFGNNNGGWLGRFFNG